MSGVDGLVQEQVLFTFPDPSELAPNVNIIQVNQGLFNDVIVAGVDLDTTLAGLAAHIASTTAHGATGANMGTTNTQTETNKTIDTSLNTILIGGDNITGLINQNVTTTGSPSFSSVTVTNNVNATSFIASAEVSAAGILVNSVVTGVMNISGNINSIGTTNINVGTGTATVGSLVSNGSISGTGVSATGGISGQSLTATGAVSAGSASITGNASAASITITTTPTNDDTSTEILALDVGGNVVYRSVPVSPSSLTSTYQLATTQSIPSGSPVSVNFPAGQITNGIGFTYTGNTFNVPINGVYSIEWGITWTSGTGGTVKQTQLTTTGTDLWGALWLPDVTGVNQFQHSSTIISLTTSQSFQILAGQNTGSSVDILGGNPEAGRLNILLMQSF